MDLQDLVSLALLGVGVLAVTAGLGLCLRATMSRTRNDLGDSASTSDARTAHRRPDRRAWLVVGVLAVVALGTAFEGIERRGMSHVEVYVPNIDLPAGISEPPPRSGIGELVWWHWHIEPHPQGYYFAMWAWTKAFGTSLTALRLPGVLLGAGAVVLIFLVGGRLYGTLAGVIAAGLLAVNGHHIYWMQNARMYEPSLFLGLASLLLWIRIVDRERAPPSEEVGYVAVTAAGTYLQVYFWPFLAGQMAYTLFGPPSRRTRVHRVFGLQTLAVLLGTPMWAHAIYRAYSQPQDATTLAFLQDFFNFGFLFQPEDWSTVPRNVTGGIEWAATAIALVALVSFLARRTSIWSPARADSSRPGSAPPAKGDHEPQTGPSTGPSMVRLLLPVATGFALILWALGREAYDRNLIVSLSGIAPLVVWANLAVWSRLKSVAGGTHGEDGEPPPASSVGPIATVLAVSSGIVFGIGLFVPFLVSRGLLVVVPALLLVLAAGLGALVERQRVLGTLTLVTLAGLCLYSVQYFRGIPGPNDYRGLATQVAERIEPTDRIFVPERDWVTTPIYYHLPNTFDQLVAGDYEQTGADATTSRIWLLRFSEIPTPDEMWRGLEAYQAVDSVTAHNGKAILFHRLPDVEVSTVTGASP